MSNLDALLDLRPHPDVGGPGFFSDGDMLHTCSFGHGRKGTTGMKLNGKCSATCCFLRIVRILVASRVTNHNYAQLACT